MSVFSVWFISPECWIQEKCSADQILSPQHKGVIIKQSEIKLSRRYWIRNYRAQSNNVVNSCDRWNPNTFITHTKEKTGMRRLMLGCQQTTNMFLQNVLAKITTFSKISWYMWTRRNKDWGMKTCARVSEEKIQCRCTNKILTIIGYALCFLHCSS